MSAPLILFTHTLSIHISYKSLVTFAALKAILLQCVRLIRKTVNRLCAERVHFDAISAAVVSMHGFDRVIMERSRP